MDERQAQALLQDPNLPPEWLAEIAGRFPRLRQQVVSHPACYLTLAQWIAENPGGEQIIAQPDASRVYATLEQAAPNVLTQAASSITPGKASPTRAQASTPARRRSVPKILALVMAGVLVIGAGLGSWWALSNRSDQQASIARLPQVTTSVRLAMLQSSDSPVRLRAVGSHGYLQSGKLTLVAVESAPTEEGSTALGTTLVAVENGTTGFPQWTVPLAGNASQCEIAQDIVDCGDLGSYYVENGLPAGQWTSSLVPGNDIEKNDDGAADPSVPDPTPRSSTPQPSSTSEETTAEVAYAESIVIGSELTDEVPFAFESGVLKTDKGGTVAEFAGEKLWALSGTRNGVWAFSDGLKVVVAVDGAFAWERDLPEGSLAINGFDGEAPSWRATGAVVVLAEPNGIFGLDVNDGSELWRLEANGSVESWFLEDLSVFVVADGVLHLAEFGLPEESTSAASSDTDDPDRDVVEVPGPASYEDLANGTQQIPKGCVEWAWFDDDGGIDPEQPLTMAYGVVPMANRESASITLEYADSMFVSREAYTFAQFTCSNGGSYPEPYFGVYDVERNLVAGAANAEGHDISGRMPTPAVSDSEVQGSVFSYLVEGIGLVGDGYSNAAAKSGSATLTWGWDGKELTGPDVLYHLPTGDARTPDPAALQELYDLISRGEEGDSPYVSAGVRSRLDNSDSSGTGRTDRQLIFPEDQAVRECVLGEPISPVAGGDTKDAEGFYFPTQVRAGQRPIEPGSFYCGLGRTNGTPGEDHSSDVVRGDNLGIPTIYISWLTVESDPNGQPTITDANWAIVGF